MSIMETVIHHCESAGLNYALLSEKRGVSFTMDCGQVRLFCFLFIHEGHRHISFKTYSSIIAPVEKRAIVAEYIVRANYGLGIGRFEMDLDDGDLYFNTSLYLGDSELTEELLVPIIGANINTHNRYYPGLISVLYCDETPAEAIAAIESDVAPFDQQVDDCVRRLLEEEDDEDSDDDEYTLAEQKPPFGSVFSDENYPPVPKEDLEDFGNEGEDEDKEDDEDAEDEDEAVDDAVEADKVRHDDFKKHSNGAPKTSIKSDAGTGMSEEDFLALISQLDLFDEDGDNSEGGSAKSDSGDAQDSAPKPKRRVSHKKDSGSDSE